MDKKRSELRKEFFPKLLEAQYGRPEVYIHAELKDNHGSFFEIENICKGYKEPFFFNGLYLKKQTIETGEATKFRNGVEIGKFMGKSSITYEIILQFRYFGLVKDFPKEMLEFKRRLAFALRDSITYDLMEIHYSFIHRGNKK